MGSEGAITRVYEAREYLLTETFNPCAAMHGPAGLLSQSRFHSGPWGSQLRKMPQLDEAPNTPCRLTVNVNLHVAEILKGKNVAILQPRGVLTACVQQKAEAHFLSICGKTFFLLKPFISGCPSAMLITLRPNYNS